MIELIRELGGDIDLLLLDLSMPKMTGFEVLDYLRTENMIQQIPIIIITSSIDSKDELRAYNYGAAEKIVGNRIVFEIRAGSLCCNDKREESAEMDRKGQQLL